MQHSMQALPYLRAVLLGGRRGTSPTQTAAPPKDQATPTETGFRGASLPFTATRNTPHACVHTTTSLDHCSFEESCKTENVSVTEWGSCRQHPRRQVSCLPRRPSDILTEPVSRRWPPGAHEPKGDDAGQDRDHGVEVPCVPQCSTWVSSGMSPLLPTLGVSMPLHTEEPQEALCGETETAQHPKGCLPWPCPAR